jgi:hypothetical protein
MGEWQKPGMDHLKRRHWVVNKYVVEGEVTAGLESEGLQWASEFNWGCLESMSALRFNDVSHPPYSCRAIWVPQNRIANTPEGQPHDGATTGQVEMGEKPEESTAAPQRTPKRRDIPGVLAGVHKVVVMVRDAERGTVLNDGV